MKKRVITDKHLSLNSLLILIRALAIIVMLTIIATTILFTFRASGAVKVIHNEDISAMLTDSKLTNYMSMINNIDLEDTATLIEQVHNPLVLSGIYVILPTCILFMASFFALYASLMLFYFTSGVKTKRDLLNKQKYTMLQNVRVLTYISLGILILMFGFAFVYIALIFVTIFELLLYFYDLLVDIENKELKK